MAIPYSAPPPDPPRPAQRSDDDRRPRAFRTHSGLGLGDITERERGAARLWPLSSPLLRRLSEREYLDAFYRSIDDEYGAFAAAGFPRDDKELIAMRVAASIRTIAAFSAWYPVVWRFIALCFTSAQVAAVIAAAAIVYLRIDGRRDPVEIAIGVLLPLPLLFVVVRVALRLPRRWPRAAVALVVAAAFFATAYQQIAATDTAIWTAGGLAAAGASAVFCAVASLGLVLAQLLVQEVTWLKISGFPEEEIIESTAFALTSLERLGDRWRIPEERARLGQTLEWIARRFENNLVRRFVATTTGRDAAIVTAATEYGASFRARKLGIALPDEQTHAALRSFLWTSLMYAATNRWGSLERIPDAPVSSRRQQIAATLRDVVGIGLPIALAAIVWFGPSWFNVAVDAGMEALRRNLAVTLASWSGLSVLAVINPRRFEAQLTAAKTLGDLIKQG